MCTALHYPVGGGYFGRTLDLEYTYDERVTVTPRGMLGNRYALIGMATVADGYPLYYDAVNEAGLAMAGLHFPRSARYAPERPGAENVAAYELIPHLLGRCATAAEAAERLERICLCDRAFSPEYPPSPLHWMLADRNRRLVVEATADGVRVYDDPAGVMTNEPPFPHQLTHLSHFARLSPQEPEGAWQTPVSRGAGALGLPGDFSSPSRFVRAAFAAAHAEEPPAGEDPVSRFFRLMAAVEVPPGCVRLPDGRCVISHYTSCMDLARGIYYYRTAGNRRITGVSLHRAGVDGHSLVCFPLRKTEDIAWEN